MTSATTQKPSATMAAASRSSRLSNFTMANGGSGGSSEREPQPIPSSLHSIWGNGGIGSFGKREPTGSRGSDDESFPDGPSGSSALNPSSSADTWASPRAPWSTSDSSAVRKASGSASPNRTRDMQTFSDVTVGAALYFKTPRHPVLPFAANPSKPPGGTGARFEPDGPPRSLRNDSAFLNVGGPTAGLADADQLHQAAQPQGYCDGAGTSYASYGPLPTAVSHPQRPSVQTSASFPSQPQVGSPNEEFYKKFTRSFTLNTVETSSSSSSKPQSQPFRFNPGSTPWESDTPAAAASGSAVGSLMRDSHAEPGYPGSKRGSIAEHGSPAGHQFKSNLTSPRHLAGTPPAALDPWSRPSSRDLRNGHEADRRALANAYVFPATGQPAGALPPGYYQPTLPPAPSYLTQVYGPYSTDIRPSVTTLPGYLVPSGYIATGSSMAIHQARDQDPTNGARSRLLDEFRASSKSTKRFELKDIYDHVVEFSGDQHGSRFIQQKLETANSDEKDQIFREIEPNAVQLMKDVFGNYVIQKFFEHGNQVQKKVLAAQMKGKVQDLSMQMYACRVVQKALEHVLVEQQAELVKELESNVLMVVKDQNGNHVIQRIISLVPRRHIGFIMDALRGQVHQLSMHNYGCRVIQRMIEFGNEDDNKALMNEIHAVASSLITDQYGNYVIQHVLTKGSAEDGRRIIDIVLNQLVTFSKHKYASNVVEECIKCGTPQDRKRMVEIVTHIGSDGSNPFQTMAKDQYANYVIQKLIAHLDGAEKESFIEEIRPQINNIKKFSSGRHITTIDRILAVAGKTEPGFSSKATTEGNGNTPGSPGLQVDVNSAAPTPVLTMEPNTPQSSSPPSTNASATDEAADDGGTSLRKVEGPTVCQHVRVAEA